MQPTALFLSLALLAAPVSMPAQSPSFSSSQMVDGSTPEPAGGQAAPPVRGTYVSKGPFSRVAIGGGFSPLGINLLVATNLGQHMNLRATGNVLNYTASNISTNGFNVDAKLSLASAGVSLDLYPFPKHGFHVGPGVLFDNTNAADATFSVPGGTSFTLDSQTFYTSTTNPVRGTGTLGLHSHNPAFTATGGWGNVIPRKRDASVWSRLSFPFEFGAAFTGAPTLNMTLSGLACPTSNDSTCSSPYVDMNTNQQAQSDLNAQLVKWRNDLNPLKVYPIFSFGVAYEFHTK